MADEPSWDDLFSSQPEDSRSSDAASSARSERLVARGAMPVGQGPSRQSRGRQAQPPQSRPQQSQAQPQPETQHQSASPRQGPPARSPGGGQRRRRLGWLWGGLSVLLVLGIGVTATFIAFESQIRDILNLSEPNDFTGTGTGDVVVTITNGQVGGDVAQTLVDAGVTKTYDVFYSLLLANPDVSFQPGSYQVSKEMSAQAALDALQNPANKVLTQVTIPEGTTLPGVLARLADVSESTGVSLDDLKAASVDLASFALPAAAPSLEGYLFPATYSFDPGISAHDMLQRLVSEMFVRLDALGVAPDDRHRVLTLAALTQKEGGSSNDFFKVARVWQNRLDQGQPLQSDATVSYGSGGTTISTTDAERADASNPYNTYVHAGLPVGPISNPGEDAIKATLNPAEGPWLYFVLINGETGETAFSETYTEHLANVKIWQQWLRDHPGFDG